jgi:hypothetical protein
MAPKIFYLFFQSLSKIILNSIMIAEELNTSECVGIVPIQRCSLVPFTSKL